MCVWREGRRASAAKRRQTRKSCWRRRPGEQRPQTTRPRTQHTCDAAPHRHRSAWQPRRAPAAARRTRRRGGGRSQQRARVRQQRRQPGRRGSPHNAHLAACVHDLRTRRGGERALRGGRRAHAALSISMPTHKRCASRRPLRPSAARKWALGLEWSAFVAVVNAVSGRKWGRSVKVRCARPSLQLCGARHHACFSWRTQTRELAYQSHLLLGSAHVRPPSTRTHAKTTPLLSKRPHHR